MNGYELERSAYYYYKLLNDSEKALYKTILYAMLNNNETVNVKGAFSEMQVGKIIKYVKKDRPDIFWVDKEYVISSVNRVITKITLKFYFTESEKKEMIKKMVNSVFYKELDYLLSQKRTDFEKALAAYEYIIKNTEYEVEALKNKSPYYLDAYYIHGVILKGRAVCNGYAKTFQYFMNRHNVMCTIVTGLAKNVLHSWNLICMQGDYYYIDSTWGDPVFSKNAVKNPDYISYDFFGMTTKELQNSHSAVVDDKMPLCTATKCNYYRFFGMVEDIYSIEGVVEQILRTRRARKKDVLILYSSKVAYQTAEKRLFKESEIFEALKLAKRYDASIKTDNVRYNVDDEKLKITIKL